MNDAETLEPLHGLGGEHGGAVVGEQRARQAAFVEGLREAVQGATRTASNEPIELVANADNYPIR